MANLNKIKHLLYQLGTINGKGKKLGKDGNNVQYFFFPWQRNAIILKTSTNWKIIKYNNPIYKYFQKILNSKKNNEVNLLKQIKNLLEKQYFSEIENEKFDPTFSIPLFKSNDIHELIASRLLSIEENFSSFLKKNIVAYGKKNQLEMNYILGYFKKMLEHLKIMVVLFQYFIHTS